MFVSRPVRPENLSVTSLGSAAQDSFVAALCLDDVFRNQDQGTPASNRTVSAADVVLYGVNIVLPLMSQDLLKVNLHNTDVIQHLIRRCSLRCICYCAVLYGLMPLLSSLFSSFPLCATSITSSSPSSVRSSQRRSHSCPKISSKASCFPWSWE